MTDETKGDAGDFDWDLHQPHSRRWLRAAVVVKRVRAELGLTQEQFAARLGVTRRTIIRGEQRGLAIPYWSNNETRKAWDAAVAAAKAKAEPPAPAAKAKTSRRKKSRDTARPRSSSTSKVSRRKKAKAKPRRRKERQLTLRLGRAAKRDTSRRISRKVSRRKKSAARISSKKKRARGRRR